MKIVCNASPMITLAKAGLLDVLNKLSTRVVVPRAVIEEIMAGKTVDECCNLIIHKPWIKKVVLYPPVSKLSAIPLGKGESEVIEWAARHPGYIAILDDRAARRAAEAVGVRCAGTLRLLFEADQRKLGVKFSDALHKIKSAGLYFDQLVIDRILLNKSKNKT